MIQLCTQEDCKSLVVWRCCMQCFQFGNRFVEVRTNHAIWSSVATPPSPFRTWESSPQFTGPGQQLGKGKSDGEHIKHATEIIAGLRPAFTGKTPGGTSGAALTAMVPQPNAASTKSLSVLADLAKGDDNFHAQ